MAQIRPARSAPRVRHKPNEIRANMPDLVSERLITCFQNVFAGLDRTRIPSARQADIAAWDSIAHVTLLSVIGEEFGIDIDFEDFESATSFPTILEFVQARTANG